MSYCNTATQGRRRTFWTTQPDACGTTPDNCRPGSECGLPGLQFTSSNCGKYQCTCCPPPTVPDGCLAEQRDATPRRFVTNDWLRSLIINILYTDGRYEDTKCGHVPGTQGGHWSESFRTDGQKIGTLIRTVPPQTSIRDAISLIKARMVADLNRLVVMKLVVSVNVTTEYIGGNRMVVNIVVTGQSGEQTRVGLTGSRLKNTWVWA